MQTAALGQQVVAADGVGVLGRDPTRTVGAARLLVGNGEVQQIALGPEAALHQRAKHDRHRRREVEHVDRSPAPHLAVDQLAPERVVPPTGSIDRHHVGVTHQAQRRGGGIGARDASDERSATWRRLPALDVNARALDVGLQYIGVARLEAGLGGALVDALIADQRLQQFDRLTGQIGSHPPSLAPGRVGPPIGAWHPCNPR
jgi:hypothetical protein